MRLPSHPGAASPCALFRPVHGTDSSYPKGWAECPARNRRWARHSIGATLHEVRGLRKGGTKLLCAVSAWHQRERLGIIAAGKKKTRQIGCRRTARRAANAMIACLARTLV